jgi:molybdopterin synthase catalytic subunit
MIREYTNRECEANRLNPADAVKRYTADEQALLDSLQGAMARFQGTVVTLPSGAMSEGLNYNLTRSKMTREALKEREQVAEKRKDLMCVNGCGILATKYRDLGMCTRCYRRYLKARKESGKY